MKENGKKASVGARIIEGLEEFVSALEKKEPIGAKFNCRVVELDLHPSAYSPQLVRAIRKSLETSQALFARFLGVSIKTVRAWEQGINTPSDVACRFMDEIRLNPNYWRRRLKNAVVRK
ncbi:MAG: helix-turn-helix domain-containing protein [Gemmataceae bacterium]|nr:helix-turn-helix domain-containing protein [Gemmataceae bacterium]